ncbi:hypothetical protein INS49_002712 [Diaporthe citri]|uniref:uncharacterized protein n=1 Tax=Diaporthe citri TaxID=83186 RepID=UPI001C815081|nr:uncharacterized protein INS49_002712 [Diaporthe citri]KAG6368503.1 hypothetical protein INS49_002712 [Diaporthe citri]
MSDQPEFGSGSYGGSGGAGVPPRGGQVPFDDDDDDFTGAAEHATRNAGGSGGDIFSAVIGNFLGKKNQLANEEVDEQAAVNQHKKLYGGEDDGSTAHDSSSMGNAAALQALKMFTSGSGSSAGSSKSEFIGLAMAEASKLFEQQSAAGKVSADTSKESAVQQAGEMALKMYLKSKTGGGESGGGGSSGLLSLASKFM